jgi:hypothetical protein
MTFGTILMILGIKFTRFEEFDNDKIWFNEEDYRYAVVNNV